MADRKSSSRNAGSSSKLVPIIVIIAVVVLGVVLYFVLPHGGNAPTPVADSTSGTTAPQPNATPVAAAPAPELSKEQLIKEAGNAFREQRYVAPPGNNALEYYLRVLEKEPNNATATDALREMFPFATPVVEQAINSGNLDEATREIDLLTKVDPSNYTLTILRGKLDARKKQTDHEQAQQAAATAAAAAAAAANKAPAASAAPTTAPAPDAAAASAAPTPAATPAAATTSPAAAASANRPAAATATPSAPPQATAAATPPPPATPAAGGETHNAEVLKTVPPVYPTEAYRKRLEGWVEVEFTVTADGKVSNATVANANPARVFNEAALRAVQGWSFKPKTENGAAVEERMKRRIEFKLAG